MSENTTPQEMIEDYEAITQSGNRVNVGRADAIYHVGKLLMDEWTPEFLSDVQADLADTSGPNYDGKYHYGYLMAWNTLSGLIKGQPLKTIAKAHG